VTAAGRPLNELERLRAAYLTLVRHLAEAHDDDRGGNAPRADLLRTDRGLG
jgi:hypothetical protein